jgi:hypothetical protein
MLDCIPSRSRIRIRARPIASVSIVLFTASYLSGRNVVTRPFRSGFRFEIVAARPNHHQQSRLCREFIGIMIDLLKQQAAASIM